MCLLTCIILRGAGGEEESIVMDLTVPNLCWAGQRGRESEGHRGSKYKTLTSLLLVLPIELHAQSFSILVIIGRHNGITFLHCF